MIDLDALVLQEKREEGIARLRNSLSDICTTREIIIDYNTFVPPCLLSASTKSMYHPVIEEMHKIFDKDGSIGIACFVMSMCDFYSDYINLIFNFTKRKNVFMLESGYNGLKERIKELKRRKEFSKLERDPWEKFVLDISLPVYKRIFRDIREIRKEREEFIIPDSEEPEINRIKNIINQNNGDLPAPEKVFVANVLYKKADGFSSNHLVVTAMRKCYNPMKYHLRDIYPRILLINFNNFSLESYGIYN